MNWKSIMYPLAIVLLVGVLYFVDNLRVSEAEARAERAEETARRVKELEAELVWHRLDDAAQSLEPQMDEPRRREAVERLRQEIQRLKNHVKLRALDAAR